MRLNNSTPMIKTSVDWWCVCFCVLRCVFVCVFLCMQTIFLRLFFSFRHKTNTPREHNEMPNHVVQPNAYVGVNNSTVTSTTPYKMAPNTVSSLTGSFSTIPGTISTMVNPFGSVSTQQSMMTRSSSLSIHDYESEFNVFNQPVSSRNSVFDARHASPPPASSEQSDYEYDDIIEAPKDSDSHYETLKPTTRM